MKRDTPPSATGRRCKGTNATGGPCMSPFVGEDGFCAAHGPLGSARMSARGAKGAEATQRKFAGRGTVKSGEAPAPPETLQDAADIAAWSTHAVITGAIDPKVAREVSSMLREFRSATEKARLEARVKRLEQALKDSDA